MIHFKCVKCGDFISVEDGAGGQTVVCPRCGNVNVAPQADTAVPPRQGEASQMTPNVWAMLCHLSALASLVGIPFGNIVGPLVVWLIKKKELPIVDDQGKESLNFQITLAIAILVCIPLVFVIVGIFLMIAVSIYGLVMVILASIQAYKGKLYRYPIKIRFIK